LAALLDGTGFHSYSSPASFYGVISFVIANNLLGKVLVLDNLALDVNFFLKSSVIGDTFCSQVSALEVEYSVHIGYVSAKSRRVMEGDD
jgi:hypothetical protein